MKLRQKHIDYLVTLHCGQWFGFEGERTYENMWVEGYDKPSLVQIEEGAKKHSEEAKLQQVETNRRSAYRNESDPLFLKWQRGEATEQEWLDKIEEIKDRFPKPE